MDVNQHQLFAIPDKSYASMAKRDIARIAESIGMSVNDVGKLNIVVAEMASNLTKHSPQGGELLVRPLGNSPTEGIEVICIDNGPGMTDPNRMQQDGISTFGTAGEGLGAIKRQSDVFDLYSQQGIGTVILSRIFKTTKAGATQPARHHEIGYVMVPKPKETLCGDGLAIIEKGTELYLLALDGLGHGANAHEASQQAVQVFKSSPALLPTDALRQVHHSIKRTRGAVGFVANISASSQRISYCGIGNIAGKLYTPDTSFGSSAPYKNLISYNGILGHNIPTTLNNQELEWGRHRTLIIHSDGLKSRWDLSKYHSLNRHLPTTVAALLYKDNARHTDDALVVVCRSKV
ncbi:ATP-binding protein [Pontibacter anaerobius]|uniref:SpoIIE family protein phosphatase n=1 Tax=Pontibacter anaerobius TaxID=2993940 RepID=A0ABT3REF1_9BACT|nr:ATP-binding protein [Pontibacter anaerobius]MCX2740222.1 SpoIIE family protein phosphatase [Pontibacter anaerobius]